LMGTIATHVINPLTSEQQPYHPQRDFTPISLLAKVPNVLLVGKDVKAQNVKELIALLKAQPGKFNYGSSGLGTPPHLSGELFAAWTGASAEAGPSGQEGPVADVGRRADRCGLLGHCGQNVAPRPGFDEGLCIDDQHVARPDLQQRVVQHQVVRWPNVDGERRGSQP
jgi:hypothetical protein